MSNNPHMATEYLFPGCMQCSSSKYTLLSDLVSRSSSDLLVSQNSRDGEEISSRVKIQKEGLGS